jgi:ribosomal protein S18 acetylase RimI-like enzyme
VVSSHLELISQIDRAYVKGVATKPDLLRSGPFLISLNPDSNLCWLNNAVVEDEEAILGSAEVDSMVGVFIAHDRMPRMELFKELWPELIALLQSKGFEIESELPVMVCTKESFVPQFNPDVVVEMLTPDSDPVPYMKVVDLAFEHDDPITSDRIERLRASLRRNAMWCALATFDGHPAAGACLIPSERTAELAGVGTVSEYRRRGAASTVSSALLQECFATCDVVWLSAGDDVSKAVYERLGFQLIGTQVNISKPGTS